MSDVIIRRNEFQAWFVAKHVVKLSPDARDVTDRKARISMRTVRMILRLFVAGGQARERSDATAGCEFLDDRIRLRE